MDWQAQLASYDVYESHAGAQVLLAQTLSITGFVLGKTPLSEGLSRLLECWLRRTVSLEHLPSADSIL
jgi:hypothetical protein